MLPVEELTFDNDILAALLTEFNVWHGKECFYINSAIPPKKLKNAYSNYVPAHEQIIGLMDNTVFGSASEGCAICPKGFYWREGKTVSHIRWNSFSTHRPSWSESNKNRISFVDIPETLFVMAGKAQKVVHLFVTLHDYISKLSSGEYAVADSNILIQSFRENVSGTQSTTSLPLGTNIIQPVSHQVTSHPSSCSSTTQFIQVLAKLDGYAIILVVLLRNNIPAKALDLLTRIPFLSAFGWAGKLLLGQAVDWLNTQIKEVGEPYMMENLVAEWKDKGVEYTKLYSQIDKTPEGLFDTEIKEEAHQLLDKYFQEDNLNNSQEHLHSHKEVIPTLTSLNSVQVSQPMETKISLLEKLVSLHQAGILTDEEFNIQKQSLLNG